MAGSPDAGESRSGMGSGESWFEPRRGNSRRDATAWMALRVFRGRSGRRSQVVHGEVCNVPREIQGYVHERTRAPLGNRTARSPLTPPDELLATRVLDHQRE